MNAIHGKVKLAYGQDALTLSPSFETLPTDEFAGYTCRRGRAYLTDRTDAGTAAVNFNDKTGVLDPTNSASPFFPMSPNSPAQLELRNPFTENYVAIWRGLTQDAPQTVRYAGAKFNQGILNLADLFSLLAIKEVPPGLDFDASNTGAFTANVSGDTTYSAQTVQDRLLAICADAGIPSGLVDFFSGNVKVQPSVYSPGSFILAALQDAADAEFPGVANLYVSGPPTPGILTFRGRLSRFDTDPGNPYGIQTWAVADVEGGASLSPNFALVAADGFVIDYDVTRIINNALFTPENILNADISGPPTDLGFGGLWRAGQLIYHPASLAQFGPRPITGQNLITAGFATGALDPLDETRKFGIFFVWNFNQPQTRIAQVKLRPIPITDPNAEYHWSMICNVEIGDVVEVTVATPHGDGFVADPYFVEGITYQLVPGGNTPDVTVTLDLSPKALYTNEPSGWGP